MSARACLLITFDSFVLSGTYCFTLSFILLQKRYAANRAGAEDEAAENFRTRVKGCQALVKMLIQILHYTISCN